MISNRLAGLLPVGTFQDDDGVVFDRPTARIFIPPISPMTDVGLPMEQDSW
jgi:hypothetical protein